MKLAFLSRSSSDSALRVLVVDRHDADADRAESVLRTSFGTTLQFVRARTLAEALVMVVETATDCVVLDPDLDDAQGFEGLHGIKARAPHVPVILLTRDAVGLPCPDAVMADAQDFLIKGNIQNDILVRSIRHAIVRQHADDALVRSQRTLAEAQRIARLGSFELDLETSTMSWSDEFCRLYGYTADHHPSLGDFVARFHPDESDDLRLLLRTSLFEQGSFDVEHRIVLPDGSLRWLHSRGRTEPPNVPGGLRMNGTSQDITDQKLANDALAYQALHDPLTGLPNRMLLLDRLNHALAKLDRHPAYIGLMFIDIDRFKVINDSLGHSAGDQMLISLAHRLQGTLRAGDTLARLGGDEFVILCENLGGETDAMEIASRIGDAMSQPLTWGDTELVVTVSTGVTVANSSHVAAESMLRDADAAMYRAKESGRARAALFANSMHTRAVARLDTEVELRRAIHSGQLETHYQPIFAIPGRKLIGMEALVRWRHPTRGLIAPDQFIGIAEETGLIVPLGEWVLRDAATQTCRWQQRRYFEHIHIAVNLSAAQIIDPNLVRRVGEILDETGLAPQCLQLEITESVLMDDAAASVKILEALKSLGAGLSIDDFGTGYSSLSYLKRFPVDVLKIDRSFVNGLGENSEDSAIVRAIISLTEALNLITVAEGVETAAQLRGLIELECPLAQGYYFARPAAAIDIDHFLDLEEAAVDFAADRQAEVSSVAAS